MSPQPSNREALIAGTLRCLELLPSEQVTARAIAAESGANLASIGYHFGSKDRLLTEAVVAGLDGWLEQISARLEEAARDRSAAGMGALLRALEESRPRSPGLARTFVAAVARAPYDPVVRARLAEGFRRARPALAAVLGLGEGPASDDSGGLALAMFHGLLIAEALDSGLEIEGERLARAIPPLGRALAGGRA